MFSFTCFVKSYFSVPVYQLSILFVQAPIIFLHQRHILIIINPLIPQLLAHSFANRIFSIYFFFKYFNFLFESKYLFKHVIFLSHNITTLTFNHIRREITFIPFFLHPINRYYYQFLYDFYSYRFLSILLFIHIDVFLNYSHTTLT